MAEIKKTQEQIKIEFGGDLELAKTNCKNGNWARVTQQQIEDMENRHILEQSIEEYLSIFKMYKQFHKKEEPKQDNQDQSRTLNELAQLIAIASNSD